MKKLNTKGFGIVQILLLLVIVGLIGGVGYYVYKTQQDNKKPSQEYADLVNKAKSDQDAKDKEEAQEEKDETADWKEYENTALGFSLKYPSDWKVELKPDQSEWVFISSPDYVPATELGPSVKAGYWLEIYITDNVHGETFEKDLASRKDAPFGGTYEAIKVDGNDAVLSNQKPHGTYWYVNVYKGNKVYLFRLNALDENKPEVKELFNSIIGTIKLN